MFLTDDSYRHNLVFSFVFHFFSHTVSSLIVQCLIGLFSFLCLPNFHPNLMTFLHYSSVSIFFLLMVLFPVLSSLTGRFLFVSMVFAFWFILSFFCFNSVMKSQSSAFTISSGRLLFILSVHWAFMSLTSIGSFFLSLLSVAEEHG